MNLYSNVDDESKGDTTLFQLRERIGVLEKQIDKLQEDNAALRSTIVTKDKLISILEDYCMNIDHHHISPPDTLSYMFDKVHDTIKYDDGKYVGDTIRGVPSGVGTRVWSESGDSWKGEFVNGKMHGKGVLTFKRNPPYTRHECRYLGKIYGLLVSKYDDGRVKSGPWVNHKEEGVHKWVYPNGKLQLVEHKAGKFDGLSITLNPKNKTIDLLMFEDDVSVGKGKRYTYKEDI